MDGNNCTKLSSIIELIDESTGSHKHCFVDDKQHLESVYVLYHTIETLFYLQTIVLGQTEDSWFDKLTVQKIQQRKCEDKEEKFSVIHSPLNSPSISQLFNNTLTVGCSPLRHSSPAPFLKSQDSPNCSILNSQYSKERWKRPLVGFSPCPSPITQNVLGTLQTGISGLQSIGFDDSSLLWTNSFATPPRETSKSSQGSDNESVAQKAKERARALFSPGSFDSTIDSMPALDSTTEELQSDHETHPDIGQDNVPNNDDKITNKNKVESPVICDKPNIGSESKEVIGNDIKENLEKKFEDEKEQLDLNSIDNKADSVPLEDSDSMVVSDSVIKPNCDKSNISSPTFTNRKRWHSKNSVSNISSPMVNHSVSDVLSDFFDPPSSSLRRRRPAPSNKRKSIDIDDNSVCTTPNSLRNKSQTFSGFYTPETSCTLKSILSSDSKTRSSSNKKVRFSRKVKKCCYIAEQGSLKDSVKSYKFRKRKPLIRSPNVKNEDEVIFVNEPDIERSETSSILSESGSVLVKAMKFDETPQKDEVMPSGDNFVKNSNEMNEKSKLVDMLGDSVKANLEKNIDSSLMDQSDHAKSVNESTKHDVQKTAGMLILNKNVNEQKIETIKDYIADTKDASAEKVNLKDDVFSQVSDESLDNMCSAAERSTVKHNDLKGGEQKMPASVNVGSETKTVPKRKKFFYPSTLASKTPKRFHFKENGDQSTTKKKVLLQSISSKDIIVKDKKDSEIDSVNAFSDVTKPVVKMNCDLDLDNTADEKRFDSGKRKSFRCGLDKNSPNNKKPDLADSKPGLSLNVPEPARQEPYHSSPTSNVTPRKVLLNTNNCANDLLNKEDSDNTSSKQTFRSCSKQNIHPLVETNNVTNQNLTLNTSYKKENKVENNAETDGILHQIVELQTKPLCTPFSGFSSASGKTFNLSTSALKKAENLFEDDKNSNIFVGSNNTVKVEKTDVMMNENVSETKTLVKSVPFDNQYSNVVAEEEIEFSQWPEEEMDFSDDALFPKDALECKTIDADVMKEENCDNVDNKHKLDMVNEENVPCDHISKEDYNSNSEKHVEINIDCSDSALQKKIAYDKEKECVKKNVLFGTGLSDNTQLPGFKTANGKSVVISGDKLKQAESMLNVEGENEGFDVCRNSKVMNKDKCFSETSDEVKHCRSISVGPCSNSCDNELDKNKILKSSVESEDKHKIDNHCQQLMGFQMASGKTVKIADSKLKHAEALFDEKVGSFHNESGVSNKFNGDLKCKKTLTTGSNTEVSSHVKDTKSDVNVENKECDSGTKLLGFQKASGKTIEIQLDKLKNAEALFEDNTSETNGIALNVCTNNGNDDKIGKPENRISGFHIHASNIRSSNIKCQNVRETRVKTNTNELKMMFENELKQDMSNIENELDLLGQLKSRIHNERTDESEKSKPLNINRKSVGHHLSERNVPSVSVNNNVPQGFRPFKAPKMVKKVTDDKKGLELTENKSGLKSISVSKNENSDFKQECDNDKQNDGLKPDNVNMEKSSLEVERNVFDSLSDRIKSYQMESAVNQISDMSKNANNSNLHDEISVTNVTFKDSVSKNETDKEYNNDLFVGLSQYFEDEMEFEDKDDNGNNDIEIDNKITVMQSEDSKLMTEGVITCNVNKKEPANSISANIFVNAINTLKTDGDSEMVDLPSVSLTVHSIEENVRHTEATNGLHTINLNKQIELNQRNSNEKALDISINDSGFGTGSGSTEVLENLSTSDCKDSSWSSESELFLKPSVQSIPFSGFKTGSGSEIKLSELALKKAREILTDEDDRSDVTCVPILSCPKSATEKEKINENITSVDDQTKCDDDIVGYSLGNDNCQTNLNGSQEKQKCDKLKMNESVCHDEIEEVIPKETQICSATASANVLECMDVDLEEVKTDLNEAIVNHVQQTEIVSVEKKYLDLEDKEQCVLDENCRNSNVINTISNSSRSLKPELIESDVIEQVQTKEIANDNIDIDQDISNVQITKVCDSIFEEHNNEIKTKFGNEKEADSKSSKSFPGFTTASGKEVVFSETALAQARATLDCCRVENEAYSSDNVLQPLTNVEYVRSENIIKQSEKSDVEGSVVCNTVPEENVYGEQLTTLCTEDISNNIDVNTNIGPSFKGFMTASGRKVEINEQALKHAKENLGNLTVEPDDHKSGIIESSSVSDNNVENNKQTLELSQDSSDNELACCDLVTVSETIKSSSDHFTVSVKDHVGSVVMETVDEQANTGFNTASGKKVDISEQALKVVRTSNVKCSESFPHDVSDAVSNITEKRIGFTTASGKKVEGTEQALTLATNSPENCVNQYRDSVSFIGFKTASGKNVEVPEDTLTHAKETFNNVVNQYDGNSSVSSLKTAAGSEVEITEDNLKHVKGSLNNNVNQFEEIVLPFGFKTASGRNVVISDVALQNAKGSFDNAVNNCDEKVTCKTASGKMVDIVEEPSKLVKETLGSKITTMSTNDQHTFMGFKTASGKVAEINEEALIHAKLKLDNVTLETPKALEEHFSLGKPSFSGFSTASGRNVRICEEALKIAKDKLESDGHKSDSEHFMGFDDAAGKEVNVGESALKHAKGALDSIGRDNQHTFMGFKTASGKVAEVNEEALKQAKLKLDNISMEIPKAMDIDDNKIEASVVGFSKASGKKVGNSEEALKLAKVKLDTEVHESEKKPSLVGFSTASGKTVDISEEAFKLAKVTLDTALYESENKQHFVGFSTASGKKVNISEDALKQAEGIHDTSCNEVELTFMGFKTASGKVTEINEEALKYAKLKLDNISNETPEVMEVNDGNNEQSFVGFSTASGKKVGISKEALKLAKDKLDTEMNESEKKPSFVGFNTASGKEVGINEEALKSAKETLNTEVHEPEKKQHFVGFNTASGKKVDISESALKHAKGTLDLVEEGTSNKICGKNNFQLVPGSPTACIDAHGNLCNEKAVPMKTKGSSFPFGFSTAGGNTVEVSRKALQYVQATMMGEFDQDGDKHSSGIDIGTNEDKIVEKKSSDEVDDFEAMFANALKRQKLDINKERRVLPNTTDESSSLKRKVPADSNKVIVQKPDNRHPGFRPFKPVFGNRNVVCKNKSTSRATSVSGKTPLSDSDPFKTPFRAPVKLFNKSSTNVTAPSEATSSPNSSKTNGSKLISTDRDDERTLDKKIIETSDDKHCDISKNSDEIICETVTTDKGISDKTVVEKGKVKVNIDDKSAINDSDPNNKRLIEVCITDEVNDQTGVEKVDTELKVVGINLDRGKGKCNTDTKTELGVVGSYKDFRAEVSKTELKSDPGVNIENEELNVDKGNEDIDNDIVKNGNDSYDFDSFSQDEDDIYYCMLVEARRHQDDLIKERKATRVHPVAGTLWRTKQLQGRLKLQDLISKDTLKQKCSSHTKITSRNAVDYKFNIERYYNDERKTNITTDDGAYLVPDDTGYIGKYEIYRAFLTVNGVDSKLITDTWVYNHYRWIVWKLASYERFSTFTQYSCLTPEMVLLQLKYRYDREIDRAQRSSIKKIYERDDTTCKRLVLCVADVKYINRDQTLDSNQTQKIILELTDGWYSIPTQIDQPLTDLVQSGKICVGHKLCISGAELIGGTDACTPLEAPGCIMLKICRNSTRPVCWYSKLGYQSDPRPLCISLHGLYGEGGMIGVVDVVIVRKYPILYMEKFDGGGCTFRTNKCEEQARQEYETRKQIEMEKVYRQIESTLEKDQIKDNKACRRKTFTRTIVESLQTGREIYEAVEEAASPDMVQNYLREQQLYMLYEYQRQVMEEKQSEMNSKFQNAWQEKLESFKERMVTPVIKFRISGCASKDMDYKTSTILTVWRPSAEISDLQEGHRYKIYNLNTSIARSKYISHDVQLTATKQTRYRRLELDENIMDTIYEPREVLLSCDIKRYQPMYGELDFVGIIVKIVPSYQSDRAGDMVYLADYNGGIVAVRISNGFKIYGEDMFNVGNILCLCNLMDKSTYRGHHIPIVDATVEYTQISNKPLNTNQRKVMERLSSTSKEKDKFMQHALDSINELLGNKEPVSVHEKIKILNEDFRNSFPNRSKTIPQPSHTDGKDTKSQSVSEHKVSSTERAALDPSPTNPVISSSPMVPSSSSGANTKTLTLSSVPSSVIASDTKSTSSSSSHGKATPLIEKPRNNVTSADRKKSENIPSTEPDLENKTDSEHSDSQVQGSVQSPDVPGTDITPTIQRRRSIAKSKMSRLLSYGCPSVLSPLNVTVPRSVNRGFKPPAFKKL
ncbi:Breast cancer 2 [Mactra antiquata]